MSATVPILEPLSTGDIIDRSVGIYRRHFRALLTTVSVPFLVGVLGWLLVLFGQSSMVTRKGGEPIFSIAGVVAMLLGMVLYALYAYLMVLAVAGLSRSVGDLVMLGTPITVRVAFQSVRSRLGTLTVGSLYLLAASMAIGIVFMVFLFATVFVVTIAMAALAALGLPPTVAGIFSAIVAILAFGALFFFVVPFVISFVIFVPQTIMIEGCSASMAISRAMTLGRRCWKSILGIFVFSYCASFSISAAVFIPIGLLLWLGNLLTFDLDTFNAINGGVSQFSSFLVIPVWAISFTLLYFDSRVRKEGYDVDILTRRLAVPALVRNAAPMAPRPIHEHPHAHVHNLAQPFGRLATPNRYQIEDPAPFDPVAGAPAGSAYADSPPPPPAYLGSVPAPQVPFGSPAPRPKFAEDGRCLRCGRVNMFLSPNCPSCGW